MRRAARNVPTFLVYVYWATLSDLIATMCYYTGWKGYLDYYNAESVIEELLLIAILFDLGRSVVRRLPTIVSRGVLCLFGLVTAGAGVILWRLSDSWTLLSDYSGWHLLLRLQLTGALLRILLLLLIGGLVEFLSRHYVRIAWGERELQIATGMGVYALASLAQSLATTYQRFMAPAAFVTIASGVSIVYELCMVYWIVSFLRPDPAAAEQRAEEARPDSGPSTLWQKGMEGTA